MAYRGGSQIDFTIDSSFQPFSLQEMLVPFTAYKEEFEKTEAAYQDLADKSDKFKYLSKKLPEGSEARQIYEGYANTLSKQAEDLARNGLSMGNRRALTSLKRRYTGEIGRLDKAQTALEKEKELRKAMGAKDSSMIYAINNRDLTIDSFLDDNEPDLYGVSGNELYARGVAIGKAESSRIFSAGDGGDTLDGYYKKWVERQGYTAQDLAKFGREIRADFMAAVSTLPELQERALALLDEKGVSAHLSGEAKRQAAMSVINGILDGAITAEKVTPMQNLGRLTAAQAAQNEIQKEQNRISWANHSLSASNQAMQAAASGMIYDKENKRWVYDPTKDVSERKVSWMYQYGDDPNNPGQKIRIGFSPAYQAAVVAGINPTTSGTATTKSSAQKARKAPTGAIQVRSDGVVSTIPKKNVSNTSYTEYGKQISYEKAMQEVNSNIAGVISEEDRDLYYFYDAGGGNVNIVPKVNGSASTISTPTIGSYEDAYE